MAQAVPWESMFAPQRKRGAQTQGGDELPSGFEKGVKPRLMLLHPRVRPATTFNGTKGAGMKKMTASQRLEIDFAKCTGNEGSRPEQEICA